MKNIYFELILSDIIEAMSKKIIFSHYKTVLRMIDRHFTTSIQHHLVFAFLNLNNTYIYIYNILL